MLFRSNGVVDADIYGTVRGTLLGKMDDGTLQALEAGEEEP